MKLSQAVAALTALGCCFFGPARAQDAVIPLAPELRRGLAPAPNAVVALHPYSARSSGAKLNYTIDDADVPEHILVIDAMRGNVLQRTPRRIFSNWRSLTAWVVENLNAQTTLDSNGRVTGFRIYSIQYGNSYLRRVQGGIQRFEAIPDPLGYLLGGDAREIEVDGQVYSLPSAARQVAAPGSMTSNAGGRVTTPIPELPCQNCQPDPPPPPPPPILVAGDNPDGSVANPLIFIGNNASDGGGWQSSITMFSTVDRPFFGLIFNEVYSYVQQNYGPSYLFHRLPPLLWDPSGCSGFTPVPGTDLCLQKTLPRQLSLRTTFMKHVSSPNGPLYVRTVPDFGANQPGVSYLATDIASLTYPGIETIEKDTRTHLTTSVAR